MARPRPGVPNWNQLRSLIHKEDFIYIADCKLCSSKNLAYIDENNGYFITIIPKYHNESKNFRQYIKNNDVEWQDAFEIQHSRKKKEINKFSTYEAGKNSKGYRIIWVHSSSKEQEDKKRRLRKIAKAQNALEELIPKLNAYHLKTQKDITKAVNKICKQVQGLIDVKITKGRKQICNPY